MIQKVVLIGIILVFLILLLLTFLLILFSLFFSKKEKNNDKILSCESPIIQNDTTNDESVDYTLISVITAAIAAFRDDIGECGDLSSFKVVAFRKAKRR